MTPAAMSIAAAVAHVHEAKCKRCGKCCWFTERGRFGRYRLTRPCPFLGVGNRCVLYGVHESCVPWCTSVETARASGRLPAGCGYVIGVKGYKSKVVA